MSPSHAVSESLSLRTRFQWPLAFLWGGGILLLGWFALVGVAAFDRTAKTLATFGVDPARRVGQVESVRFVLALAVAVLLPTLLARAIQPRLVLPAVLVTSGALAIALATSADALLDLLVLLGILLAGYELGHRALHAVRCLPPDRLETFVLCAGLGSGLLALGALVLGVPGLLNRPAILLPLALLSLSADIRWTQALLRRRRRKPNQRSREQTIWRPTWLEAILLGITASFLLLGYTMGLAPEIMSDAIREHLPMARAFADRGRVAPVPQFGVSYWPINGQVLFAVGMVLHGPIAAKLVHTAAGVLAVVTVGTVGRRYAGRTAGLVAAAILSSLPVGIWVAGTAYIDLFVVLYAALGALCLLHWQESGGGRWPLLLGVALGFGLASKLTFGFTAIAFGLVILLIGRTNAPVRERVQTALSAGAGGLLAAGPWLVRSALLTGTIPGVSVFLDALGWRTEGAPASLANLPNFGIGREPTALLRLPWELTFQSRHFGENADGFVGFAFLLLLPTVLLLRRGRATLALGLLALVPFLLWFYTAQYIRYLLPTLAVLAILVGAAFVRLHDLSVRAFGRGHRLIAPMLGLGLVCGLTAPVAFYLATIFAYPGGLPVRLMLNQESPQSYLTQTLPGYAMLQQLDAEVSPGTAVAVLPDATQLYTHAMLVTPFNGAPGLLSARTVPELLDLLREREISYVLINRNTVPRAWSGTLLLESDFLTRYADIAHAGGNIYLYRLRYELVAAAASQPELLQNPGFEEGEGAPAYWIGSGAVYSTDGTHAYKGRAAVQATTSGSYYQLVTVRAGQPYLLGYFAKSDDSGAYARLQINWLDASGKMLTPQIEVIPVGPDYTQHVMWAEAPADAAYASVYVSAHGDVPCWFDEYSFREAR